MARANGAFELDRTAFGLGQGDLAIPAKVKLAFPLTADRARAP